MSKNYIFLVPGFFGFNVIGNLNYFQGVSSILGRLLKKKKFETKIIECQTQPTGSLKSRADFLLKEVVRSGALLNARSIHFVGHSTGGLDVRLLLTPGVRLNDSEECEKIAKLTKSAIFIATPHFGTPLSNFFTTFQGRQLLRLLAVLANSKRGRQSIFVASQLVSLVARLDDVLGRTDTFLDRISNQLLRHMTLDPNDPIWLFLDRLSQDQGAILQLTPEGMDLFQSAVIDRKGVSYASILTATPRPFSRRPHNIATPNRIAMWLVFMTLYGITSKKQRISPVNLSVMLCLKLCRKIFKLIFPLLL